MLWQVRYSQIWKSTWHLSHCWVLRQIPCGQWRVLEASTQQFTTPESRAGPFYGPHVYCKVTQATWTSPTTKCWHACSYLILVLFCLPGRLTETAQVLSAPTGNFYLVEIAPEKVIAIRQSKCYHPPGADRILKMQHKIIPFPHVAQFPPSSKLKSSCKMRSEGFLIYSAEPSCCARVGAEGEMLASPLVSTCDILLLNIPGSRSARKPKHFQQ